MGWKEGRLRKEGSGSKVKEGRKGRMVKEGMKEGRKEGRLRKERRKEG